MYILDKKCFAAIEYLLRKGQERRANLRMVTEVPVVSIGQVQNAELARLQVAQPSGHLGLADTLD